MKKLTVKKGTHICFSCANSQVIDSHDFVVQNRVPFADESFEMIGTGTKNFIQRDKLCLITLLRNNDFFYLTLNIPLIIVIAHDLFVLFLCHQIVFGGGQLNKGLAKLQFIVDDEVDAIQIVQDICAC